MGGENGKHRNEAEWKYAVYLEKGWLKESCSAQAPTSPWAIPAVWDLFPCTIPQAAQLQAVCHLGLFLNRRGYLSKGQEGKAGKNMISLIPSKFDSLGWACLEIRTQPPRPTGVSSQGACSRLHMHSPGCSLCSQRDSGAIEQPESTVSWLTLPSCLLLWMHYWWWPQSWGACSLPCTWRHQLRLHWNGTDGTGHPPILAGGRGGRVGTSRSGFPLHCTYSQIFPWDYKLHPYVFQGSSTQPSVFPLVHSTAELPPAVCSVIPWKRDCLSLLFTVPASEEGLIVSDMWGADILPSCWACTQPWEAQWDKRNCEQQSVKDIESTGLTSVDPYLNLLYYGENMSSIGIWKGQWELCFNPGSHWVKKKKEGNKACEDPGTQALWRVAERAGAV